MRGVSEGEREGEREGGRKGEIGNGDKKKEGKYDDGVVQVP